MVLLEKSTRYLPSFIKALNRILKIRDKTHDRVYLPRHFVCLFLIQAFARKVLRPFGQVSLDDILKEICAVRTLCNDENINVIRVTNHGIISSSFYFIDMELCDRNLETHLKESPWIPMQEVWDIMKDVANGLAYIHSQNQVHRDLKPRNSQRHFFEAD